MAMTKEEHDALLQQIVETDDKEVMLDVIEKIRTDYDEVLTLPTEPAKDEDAENKYNELQSAHAELQGAHDELQGKYTTLHDNYVKRFFSTPETVKKEQAEDVEKDGEKKTYEKLFTEKGDK